MKLDYRDLVIKGILGVLPRQLESYVRAVLEGPALERALGGSGEDESSGAAEASAASADLSDLATQIRLLLVVSDDESAASAPVGSRRVHHLSRGGFGSALSLPAGLRPALTSVGRFCDEVVQGRSFDHAQAVEALTTVSEILSLIGAREGREEIDSLLATVRAQAEGQDSRSPLEEALASLTLQVDCAAVLSYAHDVASCAPSVTVRAARPGTAMAPAGNPGPQDRRHLVNQDAEPASAQAQEALPATVTLTVRLIEDDGAREVAEPWTITWDTTGGSLETTRNLRLDRSNLLQVARRTSAHVRIELTSPDAPEDAVVVRRLEGLTVLPPRQWAHSGGQPWAGAALATFVQPAGPAVEALAAEVLGRLPGTHPLRKAADRLTREGGSRDDAATNVQHSPADTDALVAALCQALKRRRLTVSMPQQRTPWRNQFSTIRPAEGIIDSRTGSVLEVAVLVAGVLERLGASPTLMLTRDHILVAYWRQHMRANGPSGVLDLMAQGVLGVIDPGRVTDEQPVLSQLPDDERRAAFAALGGLALAVPLAPARAAGALPQPELDRDDDALVVEVEPGSRTPSLPAPARAALFEQPTPPPPPSDEPGQGEGEGDSAPAVPPKVRDWMWNLLDTTVRNPLINRDQASAIELKVPGDLLGEVETFLEHGEILGLRAAAPAPRAGGEQDGEAVESARRLLDEERTLEVVLAAADYGRRLSTLAERAQATVDDTGANNLYLAVGTLEWGTDRRRLRSPLVLVPVTIEEAEGQYLIRLDTTSAPMVNRSFLTRYLEETGIDLDDLMHSHQPGGDPSAQQTLLASKDMLDRIQSTVRASGREDVVEPTMHLGLFEFSTYRMWRDLEDSWEEILANPLVAHLARETDEDFDDPGAQGPGVQGPGAQGPAADASEGADSAGEAGREVIGSEADLDALVESLPLSVDASQALVVQEAIAGRSLVVEGPPGTGKSQTVANLICRALATGRTVMFVAEKKAALDVVARRLREEVGVGELLLNLHDNSVTPSAVRQALRRAESLWRAPADHIRLDSVRRDIVEVRKRLAAYRAALHGTGAAGPEGAAGAAGQAGAAGAAAAESTGGAGTGVSCYSACADMVIKDREGEPGQGGGAEGQAAGPLAAATRTELLAQLGAAGLNGFDAQSHADLLYRYRKDLGELRNALPAEIVEAVRARREKVFAEAGPRAEALRHEMTRRRGAMSVRNLMDEFGDLITAITPCLLVSPDSAARFFPVRRFVDIVVFDEASQIPVAHAVGAMGRGHSTVVVGDSQQMPPTITDQSAVVGLGDDPEDALNGRESILKACRRCGVEGHNLKWHYRSRVESLIAFSNEHYYKGELASFPTPLGMAVPADPEPGGHGVSLRRVPGMYIRDDERHKDPAARVGTNPEEARQVVAEIVRRFEVSPEATPSLGVITFNARQRDLIEDLVRAHGDKRMIRSLDVPDGLLIKNLENVQGEERDEILLSTTFSASERGDLPSNFGPLSWAGGERRLNVAVTRARRQVVVFASFDPEDLRIDDGTHQGLKDLRDYLEQARDAHPPRSALISSQATPDWHRATIAEAMARAGLSVHTGVGQSSFTIDLVVDDADNPGQHRVAILVDGPAWNARRTVVDRDLLPVDILTQMGWERIERIWLPEWIEDQQTVLARIFRAAGGVAPSVAELGAASSAGFDDLLAVPGQEAQEAVEPAPAPEYTPWSLSQVLPVGLLDRAAEDPDDVEARAEILRLVRDICVVESPIARRRLIVKVARSFNVERVTGERVAQVARVVGNDIGYVDRYGFVWPDEKAAKAPMVFRRNALDHLGSISDIHPRELAALLEHVRTTSPAWTSAEDQFLAALDLLSSSRRTLTPSMREALKRAAALEE